ncbi:MBL fold metallo-hydrolase [Caulobacter sp. 1776]|uniref:ComEC/Rec2 family competence protein n=1 Tax=Caulobacter sp. 1776 TaxID=3156420 RepID=UPI0033934DD6
MAIAYTRRGLLLGAAALGAAGSLADEDVVGQPLRPWRRGWLDIHHVATGRGDSTLIIGPDGSSLMIDAGASATPPPAGLDIRPGPERRAGEWIGRYARRHLAAARSEPRLDAFLVSHLHPDHIGDVGPDTPPAPSGAYRLTGVSDVAASLPIGLLVDRGYPDYAYPKPWDAPFARNYVAFVRERIRAGGGVERFRVGAADQFALPDVELRNLAANGEVWTGRGTETRRLFPPIASLAKDDLPDENACSTAIRLRYGAFGYFAAGDLTSHDFYGALPWRDVETPAAEAAGPVDVAVAAHHGMFDATGAAVVRALRPRAWIIQGWHAAHPSTDALERMLSTRLYPGPRDVFAAGLSAANELAHKWLTDRLAARQGHLVVRVAPGGERYRIVVTDNRDEADRVLSIWGPWSA